MPLIPKNCHEELMFHISRSKTDRLRTGAASLIKEDAYVLRESVDMVCVNMEG